MKNLFLILAVAMATPAMAGTEAVNVSGTPFEKSNITFNENEFGPQLDGLTFSAGGREAVGIFFGGRKRQWCAVTRDAKEGTGLDCGLLNKGGDIAVWVTGHPEKKGQAVHSGDRTLTIQFADSNKKIVLKGSVEVKASNRLATAKLEVTVRDAVNEASITSASHSVDGVYISASAQIKREISRTDYLKNRNPAKTN